MYRQLLAYYEPFAAITQKSSFHSHKIFKIQKKILQCLLKKSYTAYREQELMGI